MTTFFETHAVDEEVAAERPYVRFEKGTWIHVKEADPLIKETWLRWIALQTGGLAMLKHPVPIDGLRPVLTQVRPDRAIKVRDGWSTPPQYRMAKYLFQSKEREKWSHNHAVKPHKTEKAFKRQHPFGDEEGWHEHEGHRPDPEAESAEIRLDMHPRSEWLLPQVSRVFFALEGVIKADAILSQWECVFDVPSVSMWRAPELEEFAEQLQGKDVYVVPDADWVDNPMVALQAWDCRDNLRGYGLNAQVVTWELEDGHPPFAERSERKKQGLPECPNTDSCVKGIDDLLFHRRSLDALRVIEREPSQAFIAWRFKRLEETENLSARGQQGGRNEVECLRWLALHADDQGRVVKAAEAIARHLCVDETTAHRVVKRLLKMEVITVDRDLEFSEERAVRAMRKKREGEDKQRARSHWSKTKRKKVATLQDQGPGWVNKHGKKGSPVFTIREDLRAVESQTPV